MLVTLYITVFMLAQTDVNELERAAATRGVDALQRLLTDLEASLRDNQVLEILEGFAATECTAQSS